VGATLLITLPSSTFEALVPWLVLAACALIAVQPPLARRLTARGVAKPHPGWEVQLAIGVAAVYGAYFGAGLGVIILAILGVVIDDTLLRANALKQLLSLAINTLAAAVFVVTGKIEWTSALIVAVGSLAGGLIGGRLASRVREAVLRWFAVAIALVVAAVYFAKL
jgi:hypothetical protein